MISVDRRTTSSLLSSPIIIAVEIQIFYTPLTLQASYTSVPVPVSGKWKKQISSDIKTLKNLLFPPLTLLECKIIEKTNKERPHFTFNFLIQRLLKLDFTTLRRAILRPTSKPDKEKHNVLIPLWCFDE